MIVPAMKLDDPVTWPFPGTIWRHRNGNFYRVYLYSNVEQDRQDKYPTTITYQNVKNMKMYSRRLVDWERSMEFYAADIASATVRGMA